MPAGHFHLKSFEVVRLGGADLPAHLFLAPLCQPVEFLVDVHSVGVVVSECSSLYTRMVNECRQVRVNGFRKCWGLQVDDD